MNKAELNQLVYEVRKVNKSATDGPWHQPSSYGAKDFLWSNEGAPIVHVQKEEDKILISLYRSAAPQLADECERLAKENERLEIFVGFNDTMSDYQCVGDMRIHIANLARENEWLKRESRQLRADIRYRKEIETGWKNICDCFRLNLGKVTKAAKNLINFHIEVAEEECRRIGGKSTDIFLIPSVLDLRAVLISLGESDCVDEP